MRHTSWRGVVTGLGLLGLANCTDTRSATEPPSAIAPTTRSRSVLDDANTNDPPLIVYRVAADETDGAITFRASYTPGGDDARHYIWLDPSVESNHRLFVFMPATREVPATYQRIGEEAARLGYHAIGLMYRNDVKLADVCPKVGRRPQFGPNGLADCYLKARTQTISGGITVPGGDTLPGPRVVNVSPVDGIENRLTKLLVHLDEQHPNEGWRSFLDRASPRWERIAVGGHSQGGGQAAVIAKYWRVDRVVMFSAVPDSVGFEAPRWLSTHLTPSNRYFGLAHNSDGFLKPIRAGWALLGMGESSAVPPELDAPPYGGTQILVTRLEPRIGGYEHTPAHHSTASDKYTRLDAHGAPVLLDAWRYLMGGSFRSEMAEGGRR
jgi:hypothetical protein